MSIKIYLKRGTFLLSRLDVFDKHTAWNYSLCETMIKWDLWWQLEQAVANQTINYIISNDVTAGPLSGGAQRVHRTRDRANVSITVYGEQQRWTLFY